MKNMQMNMDDKTSVNDFVQIKSFDNYIQAHIVLGRLQEEYINCYLRDENTVTIDPLLNYAVGGIKLMVVASQAERAIKVLHEMP